MAIRDFKITVERKNQEFTLDSELAEKHLSEAEYKTLFALLKKQSKGKDLRPRDVQRMSILLTKVEVSDRIRKMEKSGSLSEEEKESIKEIKKTEKTIQELEEKNRQFKNILKLFVTVLTAFLLLSVIMLIAGLKYPIFNTMLNYSIIAMNFTIIGFLIYTKEKLYNWQTMSWTSKLSWWTALLLNMVLAGQGVTDIVPFDIWGWLR